jgi:type I restriction enzyme S subunit
VKSWPSSNLGALSRPKQWPVISKSQMAETGYPVYGANGKIGFADQFTHETPTLLIGCRGSCGSVHITEARSYANGNAMALDELDETRVELRYLYWFLISRGFADVITGSSQPQIIRQNLVRVEVPLPPLPEQRRIAAILDQADALRAKRRQTLTQLDEMARAIFVDMFGDPLTNPKSYPIVNMGSVCDVRDGTHASPKYVSEGGYPLVTSKNVSQGFIDLSNVNHISKEDYEEINRRSKVDIGDIIMPMIGTIGSPAIINFEPNFAIKNVALIKFTNNSPPSQFIHHLLSGPYFEYFVDMRNRGGTQKFLSLGDLREFPILIPPRAEVDLFVTLVMRLGAIKAEQEQSLKEMHCTFASLQHRAFRGEL